MTIIFILVITIINTYGYYDHLVHIYICLVFTCFLVEKSHAVTQLALNERVTVTILGIDGVVALLLLFWDFNRELVYIKGLVSGFLFRSSTFEETSFNFLSEERFTERLLVVSSSSLFVSFVQTCFAHVCLYFC